MIVIAIATHANETYGLNLSPIRANLKKRPRKLDGQPSRIDFFPVPWEGGPDHCSPLPELPVLSTGHVMERRRLTLLYSGQRGQERSL